MFSSLPSASKIYVSSSRPRQKSAASAKKRKKKVQCSSSDHESITDATLVSLVEGECDPTVEISSEKSCEFLRWNMEDSLSEISGPVKSTVETEINVPLKNNGEIEISAKNKTSDKVTESKGIFIENYNGLRVEEIQNFDDSSQIVTISGDDDSQSKPMSPVKESGFVASKIIDPANLNLIAESLKCISNNINEGVFKTPELESKTGIDVNTNMTSPDFKEEVILVQGTADNLNVKGVLATETESNPHLKVVLVKGTVNNFISEDLEEIILPSLVCNPSDEHCSEELSNVTGDEVVENMLKGKEDIEHSFPGYGEDEGTTVIVTNDSSDFNNDFEEESPLVTSRCGNGTQSPEHSELSGTESFLYETKNCSGNDNSFKKLEADEINTVTSILDPTSRVQAEPQDVCHSFSYLGDITSSFSNVKHCSSFPKSLHTLAQTVSLDRDLHLKTVFSLDKSTFTVDFLCQNCGKGSSSEISSMDEKYKSSVPVQCEQPVLTSRAVSAKLAEVSPQTVLPPLPMAHVRARSYVFGSMGHTGSLLGNDELSRFFPDSQVTIFVGTWNMNSHDPPKNIDDFLLPLDIHTLPDIYAIGVQESMQSRFEWEVLLQSTLGPSHVLFASSSLGVLHLSVFIRRDLVWFCSEPEDASVATRPGSMVKTKGAVAVCFVFFGTSLLFVNSHLAAHEQKLKERLLDYEKICSSLDLPKLIPCKANHRDKDVTSRFDAVLWCGDLNFRVMHDRPSVLSFVEQRVCKSRPSCSFLVKQDQLYKAMQEGTAFNGFKEGVIHFNPSYKFDVGTNTFNSTKHRVPSYTDRILYRSTEKSPVACLHYDAVPDILTSDHKPVFAVFKVTLRPGRDNVPLAAGMFKRDIYLEAIKRRSQFLGVPRGQSAICSIM